MVAELGFGPQRCGSRCQANADLQGANVVGGWARPGWRQVGAPAALGSWGQNTGAPRLGWPVLSAPGGGAQGSPRTKDVEMHSGGRHWAVHSAQPPGLGWKVLGAQGSRSLARRLRGD